MPLRYLLDEDLRGPLWNAIVRHNALAQDMIDIVRVGDPHAPALQTLDPELLRWTEENNRILVTFDKSTMQSHLADHLAASHASPGVFQVRPGFHIPEVLAFLIFAAHASEPQEWQNACSFIP